MAKQKIQTKWNLGLLYKSDKDPQIEADLVAVERAYEAFARKYAGQKDYLEDEEKLALALADYEALFATLVPEKPYMYFNYQHDLDSRNEKVSASLNLLSERYAKTSNKLVFFHVALAGISQEKQKQFLAYKDLAPYRYFLKCIFDESKHILSEAEEKILTLMRLPARELWVRSNEKMLNKQTVKWKGVNLPINEAVVQIHSLPTKDRHALDALVRSKLKEISDPAENELNAVVTGKKISDELRGYKKPYEATVLAYQNEIETVENLVKTVTGHFPLAHKFYGLKAKMLGLKTLTYVDRGARIGQLKKEIPFAQAVEIVRRSFAKVDPIYAETFDRFLENGQIDVLPRVGKHGGAYCSSGQNMPTYVLLNHLPDFRSVTTLAHEMGHALHSKFSAENQSPLYRDYTTATAETASTLFENFVFDEVFALLSPKEQVVALHDKINSSVQTIFRQIACFNFEKDLHGQIREKGSLSKVEIAKLMNKHMSSYLGPKFKFVEDDGYFFVYWSHLRNFFYVYTYAFGELVSDALYESYKKDPAFDGKIREFLSAGGSASPEDIFAKIGVDVRNPKFFTNGLKKLEAEIKQLEQLLKR